MVFQNFRIWRLSRFGIKLFICSSSTFTYWSLFIFFFRHEILASPAHFLRKSSPYHDWILVLYNWDCEPRVKSIRGIKASNHRRSHSEHLKITLIRKHNSFPLRRRPVHVFFFANAMRCFFICSVKSGFLAALWLGKPKPFCRWCCMVRTATFSSSFGYKFFSSRAVCYGFFCTSLFIKVSVVFDVFFFCPPPNLCLGTSLGGSPLAEARSFITVDLALSLRALFLLWKFSLVSRQEF